jgi:hypothetical protein
MEKTHLTLKTSLSHRCIKKSMAPLWVRSIEFTLHYFFFLTGDLMEHLVPHPEFKMLGVRNIPQMSAASLAYSAFTWAGLLKHLRQMLISSAKMEEGKGIF